uniref:(northern house mosquito) hypothetical protein n=1 Tax=Culex pipiens TaxID=7175 RepID=A0A8D8NKM4_CULPI
MGLKLSLCECVWGGANCQNIGVCVLLTSAQQRNRLKPNVLFKLCLFCLYGIKRMYHELQNAFLCLCLFAFAYLLSLICLYLYNNVFASRVALSRFRFSHFFIFTMNLVNIILA